MLFELTLLVTFAIQHLVMGCCLIFLLIIAIRVFRLDVSLQSWLWVTAFLVSTLAPFSTFVSEPTESRQAVEDDLGPFESSFESSGELGAQNNWIAEEMGARAQWNVPSETVLWLLPMIYSFLVIWFLGSCWRFVSVGRSLFRTKALVAGSSEIGEHYRSISETTGTVDIRLSFGAKSPMAIGLLHPVILIPESFLKRFDRDALLPIVLHEYAHVRRLDLWIGVIQETLAIVFWWSPAMRILNRKIHVSREVACDLWAAGQLSDRKRYAQSLLDSARMMIEQNCNVLAMGLFSKKKELNYRLNEVLKMNMKNGKTKLKGIVACLAISVGTLLIAEELSPQVNLESVKREANHFSQLSRAKGELLLDTIEKGDYALLDLMIEKGLDINTPIAGDGTALIVAVKRGDLEMVKRLHRLGADVNQSCRGDGNPLIAAAMFDRLEIAKFLIENGANVDDVVKGDETALINASRRGNLSMVRFLVENGADVNLGVHTETLRRGVMSIIYRSPLNMAANVEIRDYLIGKGATE